jgi:4-hydroxy-tetrahydrodipicolinate synthase
MTMTLAEHRRVVEVTVEQAKGRVAIVAGAGSNDTAKAVAFSKEMKAAGATHLLHVSPMYNKPPQRGIIAHFERIAGATDLPIIVYNVPGRTGSNIEAKTTLALARIPHIAAVKEASGNLGQITDILRERPDHFSVLSGDDEMTLAVMAAGGDGIISVISNATPRMMAHLCDAAGKGDVAAARQLHFQLLPWMRAAFVESNPIPVKAAMAMLGMMGNYLRLPLVPLDEKHADTVRAALKAAGALS